MSPSTQPEAPADRTGTIPVLPVHDVGKAIDWYVDVLDFTKLFDVPTPDGPVVTGQVQKYGSFIMFNLNPADADRRGGGIYLWVRIDGDIDAFYGELRGKGLEVVDELQDGFWGDRWFAVRDLNGYVIAFNQTK